VKTFQEIENTGEWWLQEGWHRCDSLKQGKYSAIEIVTGIDTLKPVFTAKWFRDSLRNPEANVVTAQLIYAGPPSNDFLLDFSRMVRSLKNVKGFRSVCKRLKGKESQSALFEVQMASIFSERNIQVEFPVNRENKSPDVIGTFSGQSVAIECKYLEKERWEIWMEKLHSAVHESVTRVRPDRKFKVQLQLDPTLSDIHFNDEQEPIINESIYTAILRDIKDIVEKTLEANTFPVRFEISSMVNGAIFPETSQVEEATTGAHISTTAKLRRIFTNGFLRAEKQLPKEMPGIVAVYSDYLPDPPFARIIFDAITQSQPERFSHIVALIIFPLQTYFKWSSPILLDNKSSSIPYRNLKCASIIEDAFGV
jgi:Holliday junction resolvase